MRRSLNEIEAGIKKAASGAGWPAGVADDIGRAAAIMAGSGGDGVGAVIAVLAQDQTVTIATRGRDAQAGDMAVIANAIAGFDLLGGAVVDQVTFAANSGIELLGAFGVVAGADQALGFEISQSGSEYIATRAAQHAPELADGAEVSDALWKQVTDLVAKTFVPASEESRLTGAGAGTTDND
ncbi:MAG: hypothetical protein ACI861_000623 [Paracoccaceae bacterium]|jgi:hypothetical protein